MICDPKPVGSKFVVHKSETVHKSICDSENGMSLVRYSGVKRERGPSSGPGPRNYGRGYGGRGFGNVMAIPRALGMAVPGVTRTGGYYGRFNQRGRRATANELKFFDTTLSWLFDATGEVPATGQLNLIPQGVTESTRVGRKCVIKSIHIKLICYGTAAADVLYLYLVQDKQANGAAAAATDVLTSATFPAAMTNLENSDRFIILKKFTIDMVPQSGVPATLGTNIGHIEYYKKVSIPIEFDSSAATGAIGTIRSNNLFLLAGTSTLTDDAYTASGVCRLRFADG